MTSSDHATGRQARGAARPRLAPRARPRTSVTASDAAPGDAPVASARAVAPRALALAGVAGVAATAFVGLALQQAGSLHGRRHAPRRRDLSLRAALPWRREPEPERFARLIEPLGKWWSYGPAALGLATRLARAAHLDPRRRRGGALTLGATAVIAAVLGRTLDRVIPQPVAPPGRRTPLHRVFPSGHALGPSAVALSGGYLLAREGIAHPRVAALGLAVPLATGLGRMIEDKHWGSDVVGGWLVGLTVAAGCLAAYEHRRG